MSRRCTASLGATIVLLQLLWVCQPAAAQPATQAPGIAGTRFISGVASTDGDSFTHRVLATSRTSTMEAELNAAAAEGFRFHAVMGGDTAFGGSEVVAVVSRGNAAEGPFAYRLLATSRTSTMERELNQAAAEGFRYRGQTVFDTMFGGEEVVAILERDVGHRRPLVEYLLLATSQTSTLNDEPAEAGHEGYEVMSLTVGNTAFGGEELVAILQRPRTW